MTRLDQRPEKKKFQVFFSVMEVWSLADTGKVPLSEMPCRSCTFLLMITGFPLYLTGQTM